jgi:hypothetical protein
MQMWGDSRGSGPRWLGRHGSAVVGLVLALAIGSLWLQACSGDSGGGGSSTTASVASSVSSATTTYAPVPVQGQMGQEMAVAGWKISVDRVESKAEIDGAVAPAGDELLVVRFTAANMLARPVSLTTDDFSLRGDGNHSYRAIDTKTGLFAMAPVPANGSSSSYVVFAVPSGAKGLKLRFSPFVEGKVDPREAEITLN